MATAAKSAEAPRESTSNGRVNWSALQPQSVDAADSMAPKQVTAAWAKMYRAVGIANSGEDVKRGLRAAVYLYGLVNGTSREGSYSGDITPASGEACPASIIPAAVGRVDIRRFFRGNMDESYDALAAMDLSKVAPRVIVSAGELGISAAEAFATADWMSDCAKFTPAQARAHNASFEAAIIRARRARGGRTLEEVEQDRGGRRLAAQGPNEHHEATNITF